MSRRAAQARRIEQAEPLPPRVRPAMTNESARRFAIDCARLMRDDHCEEVVVLDLLGVSPICDYFVIGTGTSDRQMRAVADHIEVMGRQRGEKPYVVEGYEEGVWIIVDYVDTVVHLFDEERRLYYDLDSLWGDRPRINWAE
jgi:ribosome-associated protein